MYKFSNVSQARLDQAHPHLRLIMETAIKIVDFSVLETVRDEKTHKRYIARGVTKVPYNKTKHKPNKNGLSEAIDIAPYPIDWNDTQRFYYLAGIIKGIARMLNIELRWGGDWDNDNDFKDQSFNDLVHFELL